MNILSILYKKNRIFVLVGIVLVLCSAFANIATINGINRAIATEGQFILEHPSLLLALLITAFVFGVSSQMVMTQLGYRIIYQLRGSLLQQVLNTRYEHLQELGTHRIYAAMTKDIRSLQDGIIMLPFFIYAAAMTAGGVIYLYTLHWLMASIVVASLALAGFVSKTLMSRFHTMIRKDRDLEDHLFADYEDVLGGHKELLLNEPRGQSMLNRIMQGAALESKTIRTIADRYIIINMHFMTTLILFQIALVFWLVYSLNWGGLAMATSFALTLMFIRQPLNMAMNQIGPILIGQVSLKKLNSLKLADQEPPERLPTPTDWQKIELVDATYEYTNDPTGFSLGPLNLTINKGELIFFAGHNGAGKTTLLRLLLGLTKPLNGKLLLDGKSLNDEELRAYRHAFSAVLADFHLFADIGSLNESQQETVDHWLEQLGLANKVRFENGEFNTTELSTGQRKRLAMVSAIAENRQIMVLDEWTADQDPSFRKKFYFEILPKLKELGYTLIVVSHDDRYFKAADRILHVEHGEIVERDHHETVTEQQLSELN